MPTDNTTATPGQPADPIAAAAAAATGTVTPPLDVDDGDDGDEQHEGNPVARDLAKERRQRRAADKTIGELRKTIEGLEGKVQGFEDRDKTDAQRAADELTRSRAETKAAKEDAAAARLELLAYQVGTEKGLPAEFIELLKGTTREEFEAHADRLQAALNGQPAPPPRRPLPNPRLGQGGQQAPTSTADQFAAAMKNIRP